MSISDSILLKRGLRSDRIWTARYIFGSPLQLIPLALDTWALMRSQYWPRERMRALQAARLRSLFEDAYAVPFWRAQLEQAGVNGDEPFRALAKMPVISKKHLTPLALKDIADVALLPQSDPDHTSGSTGKPIHFYQDWHASLRSFAVTERIFRTAAGKRYPLVFMRARKRNGFTPYRQVPFFVRAFSAIKYRLADFVALGKSMRGGFILYSYTSWVVELARLMEAQGLHLPLRAVVIAGEHHSESDRALIERVMGCELHTLYASRETGFIGYECEHHAMHLAEEWAYVEVVDSRGTALPAGEEGRVVVTTFDNRVMPFIRYEIGDQGVISDALCACGRTSRTLRFRGRTAELIHLDDGRVVSLLDIAYAIGSYRDALRQYQIVHTSPMAFTLRVVPGPTFAENKDILAAMMVRLLHPRADVQWEILSEEIPPAASGKAQYFVREF